MLRYQRSPDVVAILLIQPLIVLLILRYVFAGQVRLPDYTEYIVPGIFALAVINGSATIGIGLAEDLTSGLVDNLRALPIARSAFLSARAITDIQRNLLIIPLVGALAVAVGFHFIGSVARIALAAALLLALGWMFAWLSIAIALWTRSVEATQGAAVLFALVFGFASSGFAQVATMPSWLQPLVEANPVTHVDDAVRTLTTTAHGPAGHNILISLILIAAILGIVIPLSIARYSRYVQ
jgi:ABC transporter DrrB family efflux protein